MPTSLYKSLKKARAYNTEKRESLKRSIMHQMCAESKAIYSLYETRYRNNNIMAIYLEKSFGFIYHRHSDWFVCKFQAHMPNVTFHIIYYTYAR